jgi:transposase
MAFIRKIKKGNSVYLAEVENHRVDGKVKQTVIRYVGTEIDGKACKKVFTSDIEVENVKQYLDYRILHQIAQRLQMPELLGKDMQRILLLVYTQIIARKSMYKLPEYVEHTALQEILGFDKLVDKDLYLALDRIEDLDFADLESSLLQNLLATTARKERRALVLDVTDTYFAGSQADWKKRKGKDGKYDKLIQIALAVTKDEGFPIMHRTYEGNISNVNIFKDMLSDVKLKKFDITILDRGMICFETIADLLKLNQKVITGLKMNDKIQREYLSRIDREEIFQPQYRIKLKHTVVYAQEFDFMGGKLVAVYDPHKEAERRTVAMESEKYNPQKAKYLGYSLLFHTTGDNLETVVRTYFEKDIVEKAYREIKSVINLNPLRKYRLEHINAHVKICYLAYVLLSCIQFQAKKIDLSASDVLDKLQSVYQVSLKSEKENIKWSKTVTLSKLQQKILNQLNCSV